MKITKAVMTAARPDQNRLPLQRFVDLDGQEKSALQIILEEVAAAGVEKVCVVVRQGDEAAYREAAGDRAGMLGFSSSPSRAVMATPSIVRLPSWPKNPSSTW